MSDRDKVTIRKLPTGVQGLDEILGGGLPEYSFNVIAGGSGCGKTTLANQIMFANCTPERPAIFFAGLGEPTIKVLRYQQQFRFFEIDKINNGIRFLNLGQQVLETGFNSVLEEITKEVEATNPRVVVIDSFRVVAEQRQDGASERDLQDFLQRLAIHLAAWQATTVVIDDYAESEISDNGVFVVADGIIWLSLQAEGNSVVRKLQITKLSGQKSLPGLHTFRITDDGLRTFPRTFGFTDNTMMGGRP